MFFLTLAGAGVINEKLKNGGSFNGIFEHKIFATLFQ